MNTLFPSAVDPPGFPAALSPCKQYRYTLWRRWYVGPRIVQFVGLNPSTADETTNDATLRRCIGFARVWGFDAMCMTNLFAFRATSPRDMKLAPDPVGIMNDCWLLDVRRQVDMCVACWGVHGNHLQRGPQVLETLLHCGPLHCLRLTKAGIPSHPLMLPSSLQPIEFIVSTSSQRQLNLQP